MFISRKLISNLGLIKIAYTIEGEKTSQIKVCISLKDKNIGTIKKTCKLVDEELTRLRTSKE